VLELYTLGGYSISDIDLVCLDRERVGEILEKLGFRKFGRFWLNEELDMVVKILNTTLAGSMDKVEIFEIDDLKVYVIGKEDLIVDRLNACVFWKSKDDCRWVKELILLYYDYDKIDWKYLKDRCMKEETVNELIKIKTEVEAILSEVGGSNGREERNYGLDVI